MLTKLLYKCIWLFIILSGIRKLTWISHRLFLLDKVFSLWILQNFQGHLFCKRYVNSCFWTTLMWQGCTICLEFGRTLLKEHALIKHVLSLFWNVLFNLKETRNSYFCATPKIQALHETASPFLYLKRYQLNTWCTDLNWSLRF